MAHRQGWLPNLTHMRRLIITVIVLAFVAACSSEAAGPSSLERGAPPSLPPRADAVVPDLDSVPRLDLSRAIVGLSDVVYDTFDGSFIAVDQAPDAVVRRLRDAIRPIYDPQYQTAEQAKGWLSDRDRVIGVEAAGECYAELIHICFGILFGVLDVHADELHA